MAETICDFLDESFFSTLAHFEDFRPTLVANCVFNSFLSYTAVILNIVTIHVIRKTASLPKPLRTLLLSLAVSDVGVGLLAQPLYISLLVSRLQQIRIDCISHKVFLAVMHIFSISSFLNVAAISMDRFLTVHLHLRYQDLVTHKRVIATVISIWILSVIISSVVFWFQLVTIIVLIWLVSMTICLILVPFVCWRIRIVLKRHKNQIQSLQIQEVQQGVQNGDFSDFLRLRKSAIGIFYVCIVLLICYLPYYILSIIHLAPSLGSISSHKSWDYATTLFFLNSSLNPVIYCWKMGPIRRTLIDILRGNINRFRQ